MQTYIIVALFAYLLGSIPFGYILVRLFRKQDIRQTGSGNIGATNVARSGAKGLAIATLLLDAGKGYAAARLAVELIAALGLPMPLPDDYILGSFSSFIRLANVAALFAVVGHMFPIWLKFLGGKGVATAVGAFLVFAAPGIGIALVVFAIVLAAFRYVSLASISAAIAFVIATVVVSDLSTGSSDRVDVAIVAVTCILIIARHHAN